MSTTPEESLEWAEYRQNPTIERRNKLAEKYYVDCESVAVSIWTRFRLPRGEDMNDWISECLIFMVDYAIPKYDPERTDGFPKCLYYWLYQRFINRRKSRAYQEKKRSVELHDNFGREYGDHVEAEELEKILRETLGDAYIDGRLNGELRRDGTRRGEVPLMGTRSVKFKKRRDKAEKSVA